MNVETLVLALVFLVMFGVWLIGLFRLKKQTREKGKWGFSIESVNCPACGTGQPRIRVPTSKRQALWGGWTCRSCGCEMDKWGRSIRGVRG